MKLFLTVFVTVTITEPVCNKKGTVVGCPPGKTRCVIDKTGVQKGCGDDSDCPRIEDKPGLTCKRGSGCCCPTKKGAPCNLVTADRKEILCQVLGVTTGKCDPKDGKFVDYRIIYSTLSSELNFLPYPYST